MRIEESVGFASIGADEDESSAQASCRAGRDPALLVGERDCSDAGVTGTGVLSV